VCRQRHAGYRQVFRWILIKTQFQDVHGRGGLYRSPEQLSDAIEVEHQNIEVAQTNSIDCKRQAAFG